MDKYKTFEELKEELKDDYDSFMYDMNLELVKKIDQYKNNWEELKKWLKDISYIEGNDDFCNGFNRAICGMREDILNKMKELEEDK